MHIALILHSFYAIFFPFCVAYSFVQPSLRSEFHLFSPLYLLFLRFFLCVVVGFLLSTSINLANVRIDNLIE